MCVFMYESGHGDLPTFHSQVKGIDQEQLYSVVFQLQAIDY